MLSAITRGWGEVYALTSQVTPGAHHIGQAHDGKRQLLLAGGAAVRAPKDGALLSHGVHMRLQRLEQVRHALLCASAFQPFALLAQISSAMPHSKEAFYPHIL